jgi:hypothetical protein
VRRAALLTGLALALTGWAAPLSEGRAEAPAAMQQAAMSDAAFWAIVDRTAVHADEPEAQLSALQAELQALDAGAVEAFMRAFDGQMTRAYSWDLWGAGYVAYGGMSDDGFVYFRRWAISRGRADFERLLARPDDLAIVAPPGDAPLEFEEIAYVAFEVWVAKTGADAEWTGAGLDGMGAEPSGQPFEEEPAALARRYPQTWARFGERPVV